MDSSTNESDFQPLHGSCLCGACKYTITGPPTGAVVCHCSNCKQWSGSTFSANILVPRSAFQLDESNHVESYTDAKIDAGSSSNRWFCGICGSSLWVEKSSLDFVAVTRGTVQGVEELKGSEPTFEFYCKQKEGWVDIGSTTDRRQAME